MNKRQAKKVICPHGYYKYEKNKIIFYKGVLREPHEITLIPTIKIDYNLPELHCYRGKNLTISLIWLCFCVYIGWRQTYPKWKLKGENKE